VPQSSNGFIPLLPGDPVPLRSEPVRKAPATFHRYQLPHYDDPIAVSCNA